MLEERVSVSLFRSITPFELKNKSVGNGSPLDDSKQKEEKSFNQCRILSHNINGIKGNRFKLINLLDSAHSIKANIIGVSETNVNKKEGNFLNKDIDNYIGFWSERDSKVKGSGVAIFLDHNWEKHVGQTLSNSPYDIEVECFFKGVTFHFVQVYLPPNDPTTRSTVVTTVKNRVNDPKLRNQRHKFVIMGDFNSVINKDIDSKGPRLHGSNGAKHFIDFLAKKGFIDTYRMFFPHNRAYTWFSADKSRASRIDYIWCSPNLDRFLIDANIKDSNLVTDSDHLITYAAFDCSTLIRNHNCTKARSNTHPRKIFYYDQMDQDKWDQFQEYLDGHPEINNFIDKVDEILLD